jgi:hypothetical protein
MRKVILLAILIISSSAANSFGWPLPPTGDIEDQSIFTSISAFTSPSPSVAPTDTETVPHTEDNAVSASALDTEPSSTVSGGAGFVTTVRDGDLSVFIPLSVALWDTVKFGVMPSLMYRRPRGGDSNDGLSGFGDTEVGLKFKYSVGHKALGFTGLRLKLPTGDPQAKNNEGMRLPLGTGSLDFILSQSVLTFLREDFNAFVSFALRFNGPYTYTAAGVEVTEQYSHALYYYFQADLNLHKHEWFIYTALGGEYSGEGRVETEEKITGFKDRLFLTELTLGVKYYVTDDIGLQLGATYPIVIGEQEDNPSPYPRQLSPHLAFQSWF